MAKPSNRRVGLALAACSAAAAIAGLWAGPACAAPVTYTVDPEHTFPSFEADHMGISYWRGRFDKTRGAIVLDRAARRGSVDIEIATDSISFGHEKLDAWARGAEFLDSGQYPQATYKGQFSAFKADAPSRVSGELTLHGVTRPVMLQIKHFKCRPHPILKRDWCGADVLARFKRDAFGLDVGRDWQFSMDVTLHIQVEAVAAE
jgi:polyisoprenoid-binding protein YceI